MLILLRHIHLVLVSVSPIQMVVVIAINFSIALVMVVIFIIVAVSVITPIATKVMVSLRALCEPLWFSLILDSSMWLLNFSLGLMGCTLGIVDGCWPEAPVLSWLLLAWCPYICLPHPGAGLDLRYGWHMSNEVFLSLYGSMRTRM